jgi:hypothetical protein
VGFSYTEKALPRTPGLPLIIRIAYGVRINKVMWGLNKK